MSRFTTAWLANREAALRQKNPQSTAQKRVQPSKQSEAEIQQAIADWLRGHGRDCWFVWHRTDRPTTCAVGVPDFVGWMRGVPFCLEVKKPGRKQTREQSGQLMHAQLAGGRSAVVHSVEEVIQFFNGQSCGSRAEKSVPH